MRFTRQQKLAIQVFLHGDFKASISVFFVALPLCLGISLASGAPLQSGLIAGILGGILVPLISKSPLSVSGPAAGLTAVCATAIMSLGSIELFFEAVLIAGVMQVLLGVFKLGGFTHLIPSGVIKGLLTAIGIILIVKQLPVLMGYMQNNFWQNIVSAVVHQPGKLDGFTEVSNNSSHGVIIVSIVTLLIHILWKTTAAKSLTFLPTTFITVAAGSLFAYFMGEFVPVLALEPKHFTELPDVSRFEFGYFNFFHLSNYKLWTTAVLICLIASLETLLSIEAIDDLDPVKRVTPQNRELVAQGVSNMVSGVLGGIPITAVIVRSAANVEAGARTKLSSFLHGLWLLLTILVGASLVHYIPYSVLGVILVLTGYHLIEPQAIKSIARQGREQFVPFAVTVLAILFTDLLIGVGVGIAVSIYYLAKHTYRAGFTFNTYSKGHIQHFHIRLALNVSFLNKKKIIEMLDKIPQYSVVIIDGTRSVYIDSDVLGVFHSFKAKAMSRHIDLIMQGIPANILSPEH